MYDGMDILENDAERDEEEQAGILTDAHKVDEIEDMPEVILEKQLEDARDIKLEQQKTGKEE